MLSLLAVAVDLSPLTSYDVVKPNFGKMSCWFYGEYIITLLSISSQDVIA